MTAKAVLKRLATRLFTDDLLGWSAQISYYFFLALFPALILFVAIASFFPIDHFTKIGLKAFGPTLSPLFDGSEQLIGVTSDPWYTRQTFLPAS